MFLSFVSVGKKEGEVALCQQECKLVGTSLEGNLTLPNKI